ncbi:hypothetical protein HDU87_005703 [Geranomyces variabilis]|uniref:Protein arginine N-methyltransferase n=1 Tax=Geranomyces variabilis TaxID=109894 RepID=A0AAD5XR09_9FUNG|nr:hypothetical protein HDU87_005703 [Geranomyces variabilis]
MADSTATLSVGLELRNATNPDAVGSPATQHGYSYALLNLLQDDVQATLLHPDSTLQDAFQPADLQMTENTWAGFIVGGITAGGELDSEDDVTRQKCEALVRQQIQWAAHLGLTSVVFTAPEKELGLNFPRVVNRSLSLLAYSHAWLRVVVKKDDNEAWKRWNTIRTLGGHNPKLSVALELGPDLPDELFLRQWTAEPVRTVILPTTSFIANTKGFPVLKKSHQVFLQKLMELNVQFLISAASLDESLHKGGLGAYQQYIRHLHRMRPELDIVDQFATGYHDYLQSPLQPLMDNLESATYEVFEKDPIKYQEYERAVYRALMDRPDTAVETVLMVVGAGRGPLVQRALQAAENAKRRVKLYAVEKNPNAIVTLRARKQSEWGESVKVVHCDMRFWTAPEKCDILISELLGSFGDNELSPECLDGAQRFLKDDGISIPESYTAFIAPMSSTKLHGEVTSYKDLEHVETPYVVKFRAVHELADPQPVWTFTHPDRRVGGVVGIDLGSPNFNIHNTRYAARTFVTATDSLMHGVAGYFEATLYKDVMISIHPKTHSPGMFSWFPIFFPLKTPLHLPANSSVTIHFWRLCDARKVWYEWTAIPGSAKGAEGSQQPPIMGTASALHNIDGRSSWIGL